MGLFLTLIHKYQGFLFYIYLMKYLKRFENQLSNEDIAKEAVSEIEPYLIDLKDDDYPAEITISMDYVAHLFLNITNYQNKSVSWKDIKETINRIINSVNDNFQIVTVFYKIRNKDGRIFNRNDRETKSLKNFEKVISENDELVYLSFEFKQI